MKPSRCALTLYVAHPLATCRSVDEPVTRTRHGEKESMRAGDGEWGLWDWERCGGHCSKRSGQRYDHHWAPPAKGEGSDERRKRQERHGSTFYAHALPQARPHGRARHWCALVPHSSRRLRPHVPLHHRQLAWVCMCGVYVCTPPVLAVSPSSSFVLPHPLSALCAYVMDVIHCKRQRKQKSEHFADIAGCGRVLVSSSPPPSLFLRVASPLPAQALLLSACLRMC